MDYREVLQGEIRSKFPHTPTEGQQAVIHALVNFCTSQKQTELFLLNGYAGTGKTTLLSAFVQGLKAMKGKTVLLAPTGRAAKVFANKSKQQAFTIHKKIYRKQKVANGGIQLGLAPNLHTNTFFLIDESSMIADYTLNNDGNVHGRNLLDDVIEFVYSGKNCKLVFIGDIAQLPPVGSDFSPALNPKYLQQSYPLLEIFYHELTTVLRQAEDSEILLNATQLRSGQTGKYPKFTIRKQTDLIRLPGDQLQDALDSAFSNYGKNETIVITRSNKRANIFNQQIRARILWQEDEINGGDMMMVVRNNYFWLDDQSQAGFIANGEIIQLERIKGFEEIYGFRFATARIKLVDYPLMDSLEVKLLLDVINEDAPNLSRDKMKQLFFAVEEDYLHEKNKRKRYELIMSDPYFNALQVKFAYAVTCHKSQGGQWACVFLDQGYLTEELLNEEFYRWLYTGFTRATERLYLINFDDAFFEEPKKD
jgi:exodeoxyribonuclease-5